MAINSFIKTIKDFLRPIWKVFLSGFFTVLPIALTITVIRFAILFTLDRLSPFGHFITHFSIFKKIFGWIPHGELVLVILIIFGVGLIVRSFVVKLVIDWLESLVYKIPLVKLIYSGTKQLVAAFSSTEKEKSFNQVVLVEFPNPGTYSIGFLTGKLAPVVNPSPEKNMVNVFLPTTPNPTTGFYLIMPQERVKPINITRQEAMVLIISGGIIQPKREAAPTEAPRTQVP